MAQTENKLIQALTALTDQVKADGYFKVVENHPINATSCQVPACALVLSAFNHIGGTDGDPEWRTEVMIMLVGRDRGFAVWSRLAEMMGRIEKAIRDLPTDGTVGARFDSLQFHTWFNGQFTEDEPVGAIGSVSMHSIGTILSQ